MKKIMKILPRILIILTLLPLVGINLAMAYIMFAPDSLPKPFYLQYAPPPQSTEVLASEAALEGNQPAHDPEADVSTTNQSGEAQQVANNSDSEVTPHPIAPIELRPGQGIMTDTGTKIVNLIDPTGRRYLRAGIVLEFAPADLTYYTMPVEEKAVYLETFNEEINTIKPVINDIIITLLSTQSFESVYTAEGKEELRQALIDTINSQLPDHHVIFVYFTEFVVQ